jgi:enoyl-CoA hydratase
MIERKDDGPVAVLSMTHGPVNVMDLELVRAIAHTFTELAADPPGAVVLTGSERAFSAGVDLRRSIDGGADYAREYLPALSAAFQAVFTFGAPLVAAVNGHAIAGGCVLANCADVRLMASGKARIGLPELAVGVAFPRVALEIMMFALGASSVGRLVRGAQTYPPQRALELGLVDDVVEPERLVERAIEVATQLATSIPADAFALTKTYLRRQTVERIAQYRIDEDEPVAEVWIRHMNDGWVQRYLESVTRKG